MNSEQSADDISSQLETYDIEGHTIEIIIEDDNWFEHAETFDFVANAAIAALGSERAKQNKARYEIAIMLSSNDHVQSLNKTYREKDNSTNVLSFPASEDKKSTRIDGTVHIGDIILAHDTIMAEAKNEAKPPKDHIIHLIIHGVLHLLGYTHENQHDATIMETEESRLMRGLGLKDPYQTI